MTEYKEFFLANLIVLTLIIGGQVLTYAIMSGRIMIDDIWIINMQSKCKKPVNFETSFANNNLGVTGVSALACGAYFGILIQAKLFKGMTKY